VIAALLMIAASVPVAVTQEAGDAGLAYTQCLFGVSRAAHQLRLPADAFEQQLAGTCLAEQRTMERASARVFTMRGESNAAGRAQQLATDMRRQVADSYRKLLELEPQLERLCRAHPEQCR
jgi:hypothetical protein